MTWLAGTTQAKGTDVIYTATHSCGVVVVGCFIAAADAAASASVNLCMSPTAARQLAAQLVESAAAVERQAT